MSVNFNSWVIRRVQNRRFPEATVIETYQLYEWAHYLQQTGYLPDNVVLRPDSTNDIDHASIQGTTELDTDAFQHLQQYYRETNSQYNALCKRYEHDKKRARVRHKLKEFPAMQSWQPKSGPLLTAEEIQMCSRMVPTVIQSHRFTFQDHHGRKVHLGSKQTDTDSTCSSYTKMSLTDNTVIVGRIQYFFTHSFVSNSDTFAFVNWFGQPVQDPESLILFVNVAHNPSINPIVHTSKLSGPLVIAIDTVTSTKLWILC